MKTKSINLLIGFIISISLTIFLFYFYASSESIPGPIYVISVLSRISFLILGAALFVFRISGFLRRENFFYIFVAVVNVWLGAIFSYIYFGDQPNRSTLLDLMPNLIIGILLITDIYWVRAPRTDSGSH